MILKKLAAGVCVVLGLSLAISAQASVVMSFEDDDIDFVLKPVTAPTDPGDRDFLINGQWYSNVVTGPLEVGDVHVAILEMPVHTIGLSNAIPAGQELTGVVVTELFRKTGTGGVGTVYDFRPFAQGMDVILALGDQPARTVDEGGVGEAAMIAMWFNGAPGDGAIPDIDLDINRTTNPATNCTSLANCIGQASLGELYQVDGFTNAAGVVDPDNFWQAVQTAPIGGDYGSILNAGSTVPVAQIAAGLSNIFNLPGPIGYQVFVTELDCGLPGQIADGCVQANASGTITGGLPMTNGAFGHSDFDASKRLLVPEPSTLILLSVGLLGLGAHLRRRA